MHMGAVGRPKVRHLEILEQWNLSRGGKLQKKWHEVAAKLFAKSS
jgi:hypothetical protein